jgi:hypothetical protein
MFWKTKEFSQALWKATFPSSSPLTPATESGLNVLRRQVRSKPLSVFRRLAEPVYFSPPRTASGDAKGLKELIVATGAGYEATGYSRARTPVAL